MRCLWRLFSWPKRQKYEDEDVQLPLETFDRVTLLQSLQTPGSGEIQDRRPTSGFQERYVRVGIGGAGNMRKSCFPFLPDDQVSTLLYLPHTDMACVNRVLSHNGREIRIISH
ncbi:hypothetical protein N7524_000059 [Penicillium chrysogenum]|jgi:hypothetical protein|nr:hypothetical protein N7524_000059 [Penicillium chrysogenum]